MLNKDLRRRIIEKGFKHKHGHYGSSMSCVDAVAYLYREIKTKDDLFIMSKGHGAPALHVVNEEMGMKPRWTIHLEYDPESGVEATGGSLGHGLSIALGRAYAKQIKKDGGKVYCMIGDGELQEGMIWECLNVIKQFNITNLIILVDWNKYQAIDSIDKIMGEDYKTMKNKFEAFGFDVLRVNGHSNESMSEMKNLKEGLNVVILDTIKGYGIPFLEKNPTHHVMYLHEKPEVMKEALEYLK